MGGIDTEKSFAMKTVDRIDEKLEAGVGDRVLLQDARQCLTDDEEYIKGLEEKIRKYEAAVKPILDFNLQKSFDEGCMARAAAAAVKAQKALAEIPRDVHKVKDAQSQSLTLYAFRAGDELPNELANVAIANQTGVFISKQDVIDLRKILVRYSNALAAMEGGDPRYWVNPGVLDTWVVLLGAVIEDWEQRE